MQPLVCADHRLNGESEDKYKTSATNFARQISRSIILSKIWPLIFEGTLFEVFSDRPMKPSFLYPQCIISYYGAALIVDLVFNAGFEFTQ